MNIVRNADYNNIFLANKSVLLEDVHKIITFQLIQTYSLINGIELYSKEPMCERYPDLKPLLMRNNNRGIAIPKIYDMIHLLNNIVIQKYNHLLNLNENTYVNSGGN